LPRPERQLPRRILRKAAADLTAARTLSDDPEQADEVVGFHVQQTVEKSVKAVLASLGSRHRRGDDGDRMGTPARPTRL